MTLPSLAHFPNHYTLLLQALNGALRRVYTLLLGTLQREGVPRPINHTRPCGGKEGNGFGESRWSGQSVRHVDGWVMWFCREKKPIQYHSVALRLAFKYGEHLQHKPLIEFSISL